MDDWPRVSGTCRTATATTTTASGRLTTNTQRQLPSARSHPPTNGASAAATPLNPAQVPTAAALSSGRKTASSTASEAGVSSAPPTPWSTRAATSTSMEGASAHRQDAAVNQTVPTTNTRRRPKRSPAAPPSRISAASVMVYPVTVHCRPVNEEPRSVPIAGSAMVTTVLSMPARAEPRMVARTTQRPAAEDSTSLSGGVDTSATVMGRP